MESKPDTVSRAKFNKLRRSVKRLNSDLLLVVFMIGALAAAIALFAIVPLVKAKLHKSEALASPAGSR